ncbi:MAG TPA: hypothetical protein VMR23_03660 [Candidatus Limnocylindria bacterium]|nr:hypothetical protein [Candidatus Limnocylindria bacterium]
MSRPSRPARRTVLTACALAAAVNLAAAVMLTPPTDAPAPVAAESQMTFYPPTVAVFYRERNIPRSAVLAEKRRLFGRAQVVDVRAGTPDITIDGAAATMRFRKTYDIRGPQATRRGEVVQELRWTKTPAGWKITGERDAEVIR